jgi:hypothetical protein
MDRILLEDEPAIIVRHLVSRGDAASGRKGRSLIVTSGDGSFRGIVTTGDINRFSGELSSATASDVCNKNCFRVYIDAFEDAEEIIAKTTDGFGGIQRAIFEVPVLSHENKVVGLAYRTDDLDESTAAALNKFSLYSTESWRRLKLSYEAVAYCDKNGVEGDMAVCGMWRGAVAAVMGQANAASRIATERRLKVIDPFQGKSLRDGRDDFLFSDLKLLRTPYKSPSELIGMSSFPLNLVDLCDGWYSGALDFCADIDKISVLDLDGDVMHTGAIMECLLRRVVTGGIVIMNDYPYTGCAPSFLNDMFDSVGIKPFLSEHYVSPGNAVTFVKI